MTATLPRIMLVGAAGVFGSRLARQLAATVACELLLTGRHPARLAELHAELRLLGTPVRTAAFERSAPDLAQLRDLAPAIVIDCSGPFQQAVLDLPRASIAVAAHYLDLADARDFVARIPSLHRQAQQAGVAVLSGASSTPALSHAVLDELTAGWQRCDCILVGISPGNRAPRGLALVRAILSFVGQPVRVFCAGRWQIAPGWGRHQRMIMPGLGQRAVALCETADLDLLVTRYRPLVAAEFKAGFELAILHHGLRVLGHAVSRGWLNSLLPCARLLRAVADSLRWLGSDRGGMCVEVSGRDRAGSARRRSWSLVAPAGRGPIVPVLPVVACVQGLLDGRITFRGADTAAGHVRLEMLQPHFERLGLACAFADEPLGGPGLFARVAGPHWDLLPPVTRAVHSPDPSLVLEGRADIDGGSTALGRRIAQLFGFPQAGRDVPLEVIMTREGAHERWVRHYPTRSMHSVLSSVDTASGAIEERFGWLRFRMRLRATAAGIDLLLERAHLLGLRLPACCVPRVVATERVDERGRHLFDVDIGLPWCGRLVHYRGWLVPRSAPPRSAVE